LKKPSEDGRRNWSKPNALPISVATNGTCAQIRSIARKSFAEYLACLPKRLNRHMKGILGAFTPKTGGRRRRQSIGPSGMLSRLTLKNGSCGLTGPSEYSIVRGVGPLMKMDAPSHWSGFAMILRSKSKQTANYAQPTRRFQMSWT